MEVAYQNTRNYERLSMLYLLTGNLAKLEKMLLIAQNRNDVMSRFHNALYLGDVQERIRVLAEVGLCNYLEHSKLKTNKFLNISAFGLHYRRQSQH